MSFNNVNYCVNISVIYFFYIWLFVKYCKSCFSFLQNDQGGTHSFPIWELFTVLKNDAVLFEFDANIH